MTTLYKRYIPPKQGVAPAAPGHAKSLPPTTANAPPAEPKRKRDRTDDEKAERKAKKLKKAPQTSGDGETEHDASIELPEVAQEVIELRTSSKPDHSSEFGHIKNIKKRRKLEKEARAVRKAAQRSGQIDQLDEAVSKAEDNVEPGAKEEPEVVDLLDAAPIHQNVPTELAQEEGVSAKAGNRAARRATSPPVAELPGLTREAAIQEIPSNLPEEQSADALPAAPPISRPNTDSDKTRKRRHKLEAVLDQPRDDVADPDNLHEHDEHLKKFGGILNKFHSSQQKVQKQSDEVPPVEEVTTVPEAEKRDLVPFPQPVNEVLPSIPVSSGLPGWLRAPITVSKDAELTFSALGLPDDMVERIKSLGFSNALPVQQTLIPLLMPPGTKGAKYSRVEESIVPDLAVSAPTGSGKTIAYLLPIIEALKHSYASPGTLKALVVVPTRELVAQVTAVAESLLTGSELTVGVAMGASKLGDEQQRLIKTGSKYDPARYRALMDKAQRRDYPPPEDSDDFDVFVDEMENWNDRLEREIHDTVHGLVDHVPTYTSAVDILVCTPGRLLEHMSSTIGFSIVHVEWLVLDEADKLLDQQYDGFLERLNDELSRPRAQSEQGPREVYLRSRGAWDTRFEQRVRKVVLSATMTRDIGKLSALKLRRPQMVVVQGEQSDVRMDDADGDAAKHMQEDSGHYELPSTLTEYCVPVGDGSDKPLHLVALLDSRILRSQALTKKRGDSRANGTGVDLSVPDNDLSDSDTESDDSLSSSNSSTISNGTDVRSSESSEDEGQDRNATSRLSMDVLSSKGKDLSPTILVFTSSTESAERLTHLLSKLRPDWATWISSMTKSTGKTPKVTGSKSAPVITIATDRAGRGLDSLHGRRITHVIQYDVPRSLTAYVHRVGRSARAGDSGEAWTLYTDREARWYVHEIMRATNVKRTKPVERVRVDVGGEQMAARYAEELGEMREMVFGK